ncbi:MAG TPA: ATP-binding protein [Acidobacteriaceae bacterium]|jgi:serine/threonine-protein kinase RsbW|nr:ATP-binding protein [Acidobacteriaceae bacterium]
MADPTTSRVHYSLDSTLASINTVEQTVHDYALKAGFPEDELCNISLAAREAAVNAVVHGNRQNAAKKVDLSLEFNDQALTIRIADQGEGFDPDSLPDPLAPENILRGSGRGIFLIRTFMDELKFRRLASGTELTLVKYKKISKST